MHLPGQTARDFPTPHLSVDEESSGSRPPINRKLTPVRATPAVFTVLLEVDPCKPL
jgi:hypothetical protein